jgi:hypothetical protein
MINLTKMERVGDGLILHFKGKEKKPHKVLIPQEMIEEVARSINLIRDSSRAKSRHRSVLRKSVLDRERSQSEVEIPIPPKAVAGFVFYFILFSFY